jgi:thiamine pyrophosphokinase
MINKIKQINFSMGGFDAVICLNADLPDHCIFDKIGKIPVFAADGAAYYLKNIGIIPDYIIGDLDSFNISEDSASFSNSKILKIADQEKNDFEKNIVHALSLNYHSLLILGLHGGQLEHTLNNWSVLMRFSRIANLCIYDSERYGIPLCDSAHLTIKTGETISLIPQPRALLTTKHLKWELNNEVLEMGIRDGAHNIAVNNEVEIILHSGSLLVFIDERLPFSPVFV